MILYKYRSLDNLWHLMDLVFNQRVYCAHWSELNDPLEGKYEILLGEKKPKTYSIMENRIEKARDNLRIASFSSNETNFLLWSHYANGHKGVAVEVYVDDYDPSLYEVIYSPFSSTFTEKEQPDMNMYHLFNGKTEEWRYEEEYRIITESKYFELDGPVKRILLGPQVSKEHVELLKKILPETVELVQTDINQAEGILEIKSPIKSSP